MLLPPAVPVPACTDACTLVLLLLVNSKSANGGIPRPVSLAIGSILSPPDNCQWQQPETAAVPLPVAVQA